METFIQPADRIRGGLGYRVAAVFTDIGVTLPAILMQ